ncbi:MAG: hypothetical protein WCV82_02130 [Candidatus Paceibacterota bacterium]
MKIKAYRGASFYKRLLLIFTFGVALAICFGKPAPAAICLIASMIMFFYYEARMTWELRKLHLKLVNAAHLHLRQLPSTITTNDPIRREAWKVFCLRVGTHLRVWPNEKDPTFIRTCIPLYHQYISEW